MARSFVHGLHLCQELVGALGITKPVRSITVEANCSKAALVTVEFVPSVEDSDKITQIMKRYRLEAIEPE